MIAAEKDPTLRDLLKVFSRRRRAILWIAATVLLLSILISVFTTRRYQATSEIQLQKSSADGLNLDSMIGGATGGASDALSVNVDLQTQSNILQSETLALKVIKDMNLEDNADFRPQFNPIGWFAAFLTPGGPADPIHASLEDSPHRRQRLLGVFKKNLTVKVVAGTRLIEVGYRNPSPKVAAEVVNHLVQGLIDYTFQTRFVATNEVSQWLEGQLADMRKENEALQTKVVALQKETGLFGAGGVDFQGKPVVFSPTLGRLEQITSSLSEAQMNKISKGSVYEVVKSGDPELISQLSGTTLAGGASQGVANGLAVIQNLRTREADIEQQLAQDAAKFGPAYPKLLEERASLKRVQQSLQDEISRTGARAKNDYDIATKIEQGARQSFASARVEANKLNDKTIEYAIVEREATQSQQLYQDMLRRLKEAGILEGLRASNITVIDPGRPPAKPSSPNIRLNLALGLVLGIFFGCSGALLIDALDNQILGPEEVETLQLPFLGILPQFPAKPNLETALLSNELDSRYAEALRSLRSTLLISRSGTPPQVILVTSASPNEGKSSTSLSFATALAQFNRKVLLVESDMRRPVLRKRLSLEGQGGLSVLLANEESPFEPSEAPWQPNLHILPAGPVPPYPAELLGAPRLATLLEAWRAHYDFVVIDSPPVLPVVDSRVLSELADVTVLVARAGMTSRTSLQRCFKLLLPHAKDQAAPGIGVVVNAIMPKSQAYYGYYGYYGYNGYKKADKYYEELNARN